MSLHYKREGHRLAADPSFGDFVPLQEGARYSTQDVFGFGMRYTYREADERIRYQMNDYYDIEHWEEEMTEEERQKASTYEVRIGFDFFPSRADFRWKRSLHTEGWRRVPAHQQMVEALVLGFARLLGGIAIDIYLKHSEGPAAKAEGDRVVWLPKYDPEHFRRSLSG